MGKITLELEKRIQVVLKKHITESRKKILKILIEYFLEKLENNHEVNLNFICTHNSRRSQFCQIWSYAASHYFKIPIKCHSGGTEITECNIRTINSIKLDGFLVSSENNNRHYLVSAGNNISPIKVYSKLFNESINKNMPYAAVMTCSDADKNCPFIPGAEKRISLPFEDPKEFDDTLIEAKKYKECSLKIASEVFYVFNEVDKSLNPYK